MRMQTLLPVIHPHACVVLNSSVSPFCLHWLDCPGNLKGPSGRRKDQNIDITEDYIGDY